MVDALSHLYLNIFLPFHLFHVDFKALGICVKGSWIKQTKLIFSTRLDGRKDFQFLQSAWSICSQTSQPTSYTISKRLIKDVKRTPTHTHIHAHTHARTHTHTHTPFKGYLHEKMNFFPKMYSLISNKESSVFNF